MKGILITGITGFTGMHLVEYLSNVDRGTPIIGTSRSMDFDIHNVAVMKVDFTKFDEVKKLLEKFTPEYIFHLAACNRGNYKEIYNTNVLGTINLFEALKDKGRQSAKVLVTGSVAEYGIVNEFNTCIDETAPLAPITLYGNSKVSQDLLSYQYYRNYGINIVRVRASNLMGPGQSSDYVCSAIAKQIVEIEKHRPANALKVGNLDPKRDFIDVRDAVSAYWRVINSNSFGQVFNVCSGNCISVRDVLNCFLELTEVRPKIVLETKRARKFDIMYQRYNYEKLNNLTGWTPKKELKGSLSDVLEYWRSVL